ILDVAPSGQLVASLAVFASALAVALTRDRSVPAAGASDSSCREHQVDIGENVLNALRVMLYAPGVKHHRCFRRSPDLRSAHDASSGYARNAFRNGWRVRFNSLASLLESGGVFLDKLRIDPPAVYHDVQDSIGQRAVSAGPHRKEEVGGSGN